MVPVLPQVCAVVQKPVCTRVSSHSRWRLRVQNRNPHPPTAVIHHNTSKEDTMGRATAHPDHHFISSEDVEGTAVYDPKGTKIGEIDHLIIDKLSGRVGYAVMSFGGFLGVGHSHYPIPWSALSYEKSLAGFRTNVSEKQLKDAPAFSDDSWEDRDWETRTHRHYGTRGYWELGQM